MEREERESWALFYETGLPQAYTYLKERQTRQQTQRKNPKAPQEGQSRGGR